MCIRSKTYCIAKIRLGNAEKCLLYNFITFFQECFSGLADFQYISGLAISGLKNLENYQISV
jgi:hypothetical protein